jgi:hypothetical protein
LAFTSSLFSNTSSFVELILVVILCLNNHFLVDKSVVDVLQAGEDGDAVVPVVFL